MEACRCKAWNSAIAELECARAELDSASREIWEAAAAAETGTHARSLRGPRAALLQVVPVAVLILFLAVGPTSMDSTRSSRSVAFEAAPSVDWVTPDEKILLENLRKSLSGNLAQSAPEGPAERIAVGRPPGKNRLPGPAEAGEPAQSQVPKVAADRGMPVAAEDLLSLIQVGQRALRSDEEALRIERP